MITERKKVKHIFHISDIHIRLYRRSREYKSVLHNLVQIINQYKTEQSIIVITGDIFHSKIELSPESITMAHLFLDTLSDILPTIIIAGNHDANLSNENRLDSLTPIVNLINKENLIYYRDTGWYKYDNLNFWVSSVFDERLPEEYPKEGKKILLYHGCVNNVKVNNIEMSSRYFIKDFKKFDYVLLGDIHKTEQLSEKPLTAYAGSLMQLNFGQEVEKHGLLLWNLDQNKYNHLTVENDFAFYNVIVQNGQIAEIPPIHAKHPRIKIKYYNTSTAQLKDIQKQLRETYDVQELMLVRINEELEVKSSTFEYSLENLDNVQYQETLIKDYIQHSELSLKDGQLQSILQLNKEVNSQLKRKTDKKLTNLWSVEKLEFDNFFSYGQGNEIDFTAHKGIIGITGENRAGKSSLIDIILFMLYDKTSRTGKALSILNHQKSNLWGRLTLSINGRRYVIEKQGKVNKKRDAIPIKCKFYNVDENGQEVDLSGTERASTNAIISQYVGEYDDAISTFFSTQGNSNTFIQMTSANRKTQLNSLLNLTIFDECYNEALNKSKIVKHYLTNTKINEIETKLNQAKDENKEIKKNNKEREQNLNQITQDLKDKQKKLKDLLQQKRIELEIDVDIDELNSKIERLTKSIESDKQQLGSIDKVGKQEQIDEIEGIMGLVDIETKRKRKRALQDDRDAQNKISMELSKLQVRIKEQDKKLALLDRVQWDEDCSYCMNNPLTLDAIESKKQLKTLEIRRKELKEKIDSYNSSIEQLKTVNKEIELYDTEIIPIYNRLNREYSELDSRESLVSKRISSNESTLITLEQQKKEYLDNEQTILQNKRLHQKIEELQSQIDILEIKEKQLSNIIVKDKILLSANNQIVKHNSVQMKEYGNYMEEFDILQKYKVIMGRSGLQYYITSNIVTVLEGEMNKVLEILANFSVEFIMSGKSLDLNIVYSDKSYPVETCSGFQKFIISLALRHTLSMITNKSKARMFVIDEGFGALDSENISSFDKVFEFISDKYDTLLVISHLQVMRSMFEDNIQIQYKDGISKIL